MKSFNLLKKMKKIILSIVVFVVVTFFPSLGVAKDFIIAAQSATFEEAMIVINKMKEEGGQFEEVNGKYGSKYYVLTFKKIPNTKLIYQLIGMGMENATLQSILLAEGIDLKITPDLVINSGTCGNVHSNEIGNLYLPKYFVISNFGKLTDTDFENWPVRTWNPISKDYEIKTFFKSNNKLQKIGEDSFIAFKKTKEYKSLSASLKQNIKVFNTGIGLSDNELTLSKKKTDAQKRYYKNLLYTQLYEKTDVHVVDMETAACAKVFYEKNIPFAGIRVPSDAASGIKKEGWSKLAKKVLGEYKWRYILEVANSGKIFK